MVWLNKKEAGSGGLLIMTIIAVAISAAVAIGLTKMNSMNFRVAQHSNDYMQARQYGQERANILRSTTFSALAPLSRRAVGAAAAGDSYDFYEEVTETVSGIYKDYTVNIYKGADNNRAIVSLVVRRTDPKALVDGTTTNSSLEDSDTSALTANASQRLMNGKISADKDSTSGDTTMSAKVFKEYVEELLVDYAFKDNIVTRPDGEAVGGPRVPIYVDPTGMAKITEANFRLNENLGAPNVGILVTDSNGNFYLDYEDKTIFLKNGG
nr:MAG TPA_asm: PilX N-terminal [Caudoviricetes sp.]